MTDPDQSRKLPRTKRSSSGSGTSDGTTIPSNRLSRLAGFGSVTTGIAGNVITQGVRTLARGKRPDLSDLLLTPANATKVTDQLARLRGAAMKIGQLISMDAGDVLPPELADIMARLRAGADPMPGRQLKIVLNDQWGRGWLQNFSTFDVQPLAAASIGQVHRARTKTGEDLAIKIQYPGIRQSIDSDVDNVGMIIRMSGLLPKDINLAEFLDQAKIQLHDEANYEQEAIHLASFGKILSGSKEFTVPSVFRTLTTETILAMTYEKGIAIESLADAHQHTRNSIVRRLMNLILQELFDFHLMQTDPNFANYLYDETDDKIVLLDFGATQRLSPETVDGYRILMQAILTQDNHAVETAMHEIGILSNAVTDEQRDIIMQITSLTTELVMRDEEYDFGACDLIVRLRDISMALKDTQYAHIPPIDTLFLQRKIGGIYLLACRLRAKVNVRQLVFDYL